MEIIYNFYKSFFRIMLDISIGLQCVEDGFGGLKVDGVFVNNFRSFIVQIENNYGVVIGG